MAKKKVVVTGASGYVAACILDALREEYELTLLDVKTTNWDGEEIEGIHVVDLIDPDRDAYRQYFTGADAVVHCGHKGTVDWGHRDYWKESDNVRMCWNVYQTAAEEGVQRAVVMSSNHACDFYERLIWANKLDFATPDMLPLSDNYYGWAKSTYELLGFAFAAGKLNDGRILENVHIRIGAPRESVMEGHSPDNLNFMRRESGAYLSARDLSQLVIKSLETEDITNEYGVPFQVFFGISANANRFWSIDNARRVIGYEPEDDSNVRFADQIADVMLAAQKQAKLD